uniref:Tctex1 domain-containing protein 2 n=1 Tax=Romanomermis culicivorax TaxID=13658 RepID=A0A915JG47_ROMCU
FRPLIIKVIIKNILTEELVDKDYDSKTANDLAINLSKIIKAKLKELDLPRYKFLVNVLLCEQKGAGMRCLSKCFWDSDTDGHCSEIFMNDSLICVASIYAVYYY